MSNLYNLLKINFANNLKLFKRKSFASYINVFLFLALFIIIEFFIYRFAKYMVNSFVILGLPSMVISEFFAFTSMFCLALSIFKIDIFNSRDNDLLASLPITKKTIVASKLINSYIINFVLTSVLMIPAFLAYFNIVDANFSILVTEFISLLIIPIIPTAIAVLLNSFITIISTNFRHQKIIYFLLMIVLIVLSIYYAYYLNSTVELDIFEIEASFNNFFNTFYPLTNHYHDMIINHSFNSALFIIAISFASIIILIIFLSLFYTRVTSRLVSKGKRKRNVGNISNRSFFSNLVIKEIKKVISNPNYILNSCLALIFLGIVSICFLFINIDNISNIPITEELVIKYLPLIFIFVILLSSTSCVSVSLEGKYLYILKMLPVKFRVIWQAKVLSNYLLIIILAVISLVIFNVSLTLNFHDNLIIALIILVVGLFVSVYGFVVNILFPKFSWKSESAVIKNSVSPFITMYTAIILGLYLLFNSHVSSANYIYIVIICFGIATITLIIFLYAIGAKIFSELKE